MKYILVMFILSGVFLLSGCEGFDLSKVSDEDMQRVSDKLIVCKEPYIRHGMDCCLDKNKNSVCDLDEEKRSKDNTAILDDPNLPINSTQTNPKYLLFQKTGASPMVPAGNPVGTETKAQVAAQVGEIVTALGGNVGDHVNTQLGFTAQIMPFDLTDDQIRTLIANSFAVAEEKNIAVAFHIDDSMFWNRRSDLWSDKHNVEWTDWSGTSPAHRIIGWVPAGQEALAPPMCYNSPAIIAETTRLARDVIGKEIKKNVDRLDTVGKGYLFAGVITGWETRLQDDSGKSADDSEPRLGYCALKNLGYSASIPPANIDTALKQVVADWIVLWTKNIAAAGIPTTKIYTHIGVTPETSTELPADKLQRFVYKNAPPEVAFNQYSRPGFSTYGFSPGKLSALYSLLAAKGSPPWGISEGTNVKLADSFIGGTIASGYTMEQYLAGAFNHGAVYVNLFGWSTTDTSDFAKSTTGTEAIAAYKKFLSGERLVEGSNATVPPPSGNDLYSKVQKIQTILPNWLPQHPDQYSTIQSLMTKLNDFIQAGNTAQAEKVADEVLKIVETNPVSQVCPTGTTGTYPNCTPAPGNDLNAKIQTLQSKLPLFLSQHPALQQTIQTQLGLLDYSMRTGNAAGAEQSVDLLLRTIISTPNSCQYKDTWYESGYSASCSGNSCPIPPEITNPISVTIYHDYDFVFNCQAGRWTDCSHNQCHVEDISGSGP